jgi:hypothetical protein
MVVATEDPLPQPLAQTTIDGWTELNTEVVAELDYTHPHGMLSVEAMEGLIFLRNGERLARDVARALMDYYGSHPFFGQSEAERSHGEAIGQLMTRYALYDSVSTQLPGEFSDPYWQSEYDFYLSQAELGYIDALLVSVEIQEAALVDLRYWNSLSETDYVVVEVIRALLLATRNHLRLLNNELESVGYEYTPMYLSGAAYADIVYSPLEYWF